MLRFQEAGSGIPLVLLHAFPLAGEMWQPQFDALSDKYHVIAPNLLDGTSSIDDMARSVMALLEKLNLHEPVVVCGLSMGGYTALAFARLFPAKLRGLILCDTRAEADSEEAKANRDTLIELVQNEGAAALIEKMLPRLLGQTTRKTNLAVVEDVRTIALRQSPAAIANALRALRDRSDSLGLLPQIAVPTLVIVGDEDEITPLTAAQTLATQIPGARLQIMAGAGHLSSLEQPEAFNEAVRRFMNQIL